MAAVHPAPIQRLGDCSYARRAITGAARTVPSLEPQPIAGGAPATAADRAADLS